MTLIAGSPMIWDNSFSGPSIRAVILRQLPIPIRTVASASMGRQDRLRDSDGMTARKDVE